MRPTLLAGVVIICLGAYLLVRGGTFTREKEVLKIGDVRVSAPDKESIPPWVGGLAVAVGAALMVAGAQKKS